MIMPISRWLQSRKALHLAQILLLLIVFLILPLPANAATHIPVNSRLEEQVLQIIQDHPEVILESVQAYQQKQYEEQRQASTAFLQEMKANPQGAIGKSPTTGAKDQKIVLLEFSDFECPYCGKVDSDIKKFVDSHSQEITLVYKHFPLAAIHPEALPSAKAAWAASQQGKFWEYHDALFAQQENLGEILYLETAKNLNLDLEQFNQDRNSTAANQAIGQDMLMAQRLGISGTPFFVMNGEAFAGAVQLSDLEKVLARINKA